jgi:thymidine kinase
MEGWLEDHGHEYKYPAYTIANPREILDMVGGVKALEEMQQDRVYGRVFIDEVQFIDASILPVVRELQRHGIDVYCAGLFTDSWGEVFNTTATVASAANSIITHHSTCARCGSAGALYTYRKCASKDRVCVGGADEYEPRCLNCMGFDL